MCSGRPSPGVSHRPARSRVGRRMTNEHIPNTGETFSAFDAVAVQRELRQELGLDAEVFPLPAFIGMISDEIQLWREAGRTDSEIAEAIRKAIGHKIDAGDIAQFYAPPEERRQHRS